MNLGHDELMRICDERGYAVYKASSTSWRGDHQARFWVNLNLDCVNGGRYMLQYDMEPRRYSAPRLFIHNYKSGCVDPNHGFASISVTLVNDRDFNEISAGQWTWGRSITTPTMEKVLDRPDASLDDLIEVINAYETRKRKAKKAEMRSEIRNEGMDDLSDQIKEFLKAANYKCHSFKYEIIKKSSESMPFTYTFNTLDDNLHGTVRASKRHDHFSINVHDWSMGNEFYAEAKTLNEIGDIIKTAVPMFAECKELYSKANAIMNKVKSYQNSVTDKYNKAVEQAKREREAKKNAAAEKDK